MRAKTGERQTAKPTLLIAIQARKLAGYWNLLIYSFLVDPYSRNASFISRKSHVRMSDHVKRHTQSQDMIVNNM